jgi:hypothetical protein
VSEPWPNMSRCQVCGLRIEWKSTVSGMRIPLDAMPSAAGTLRLLESGHVQVIPTEERATDTRPRYTSHWNTCPATLALRQGKPRHEP